MSPQFGRHVPWGTLVLYSLRSAGENRHSTEAGAVITGPAAWSEVEPELVAMGPGNHPREEDRIGLMAGIASFHLVREPPWRAPVATARLGTDRLRVRAHPG